MPNKKLGKSKNTWIEMDQFSQNVLSGEYTSSSGNVDDELPPICEENTNKEKKLETASKEGNEDRTSEEIKTCLPADDNIDELNAISTETQPDRASGSKNFNANLPTISEEQPEGVAVSDALPSGEKPNSAKPSEGKNTEVMLPFTFDICVFLEDKSLVAKQAFSKYVTDWERHQIELVFSGLKTSVIVCGSGASLHLCTKKETWIEQFYGVPVVVVESKGPTNTLWLYLAERGTGLPLWRDTINWKSEYTRETNTLHVMCVASNQCEKMALAFDCETAATAFWVHINRLTSKLENLGVSLPQPSGSQQPHPHDVPGTSSTDKKDISEPCFFEHVTSMRPEDYYRFLSLQRCDCPCHDVQEEEQSANDVPDQKQEKNENNCLVEKEGKNADGLPDLEEDQNADGLPDLEEDQNADKAPE